MLKILKTPILGNEDTDIVAQNSNYKTTIGFDDATETIAVKIEKVVREDLNRDEHAPVTYETLTERSYTKSDFVKQVDNNIWFVEYDCNSNQLSDPIKVWEYTAQFAVSDSPSHTKVGQFLNARVGSTKIPVFLLEDFYKSSIGFSTSVLTYYFAESPEGEPAAVSNTVINNDAEEVSLMDKFKYSIGQQTHAFFEILNADGTVDEEKTLSLSQVGLQVGGSGLSKVRGNNFSVNLPAAEEYKIRVTFTRGLEDKSIPVKFDVRTINGVSSKDRLIAASVVDKPCGDYSYLGDGYQDFVSSRYVSYDNVVISNKLEAGDNIKFKLDCGSQFSYAELNINLV